MRVRNDLVKAVLATVVVSLPAAAGESVWLNAAGGSFHDPRNWSGGVPGAGALARFDLPAMYTVEFDAGAVTDRAMIDGGIVQIDLGAFIWQLTGALPAAASLTVGESAGSSASLDLAHGALHANHAAIGLGSSAFGSLRVGPGGVLETALHLDVGREGLGMLQVVQSGTAIAGRLHAGVEETGLGLVTIAGAGAATHALDGLTVGVRGAAMLHVVSGASLYSGPALVGQVQLGSGSVSVDGAGSSWIVDGSLTIGFAGAGELLISGGGEVMTDGAGHLALSGSFGAAPISSGSVEIGGAGSRWIIADTLFVGSGGEGSLLVHDGGALTSDGAVIACCSPGSADGVVTVAGAGSTWSSPAPLIIRSRLIVREGGVVEAPLFDVAAQSNFTDGVLEGDGALIGDVVCTGTLAPNAGLNEYGAPLPGTMSVTGDVTLAPESTFAVAVGAEMPGVPVSAGRLVVDGSISIDGTLKIDSLPIQPGFQQGVELITADSISGAFTAIDDPWAPSAGWALIYQPGSVWLFRGNAPFGDATFDGIVDVNDLIQIVLTWGPCPAEPMACSADFSGDGVVGVNDLVYLLANWD